MGVGHGCGSKSRILSFRIIRILVYGYLMLYVLGFLDTLYRLIYCTFIKTVSTAHKSDTVCILNCSIK